MKRYTIAILIAAAALSVGCNEDVPVEVKHTPKILSIIPKAGYPGTEAVISGYWLNGEKVSVTVGGDPASILSTTIDRITVTMPEKALGTWDVSVTVDDKTMGGLSFRYAEHPPKEVLSILSYQPSSGIEGDEIVISGTCFSPKLEKNSVSVDGTPCTITSASENRLVVIIPDKPEGQYQFVVTVDGETVTGPLFTYNKKPELTVLSVSPNTGVAGDIVTVSGICFSAEPSGNIVTINDAGAEVLEASTTRLKIVIPENPVGSYPVVVTADGKTATGPNFLYQKAKKTYTTKTISGSTGRNASTTEFVDGPLAQAKWRLPRGISFISEDELIVMDEGVNAIRKIDLASGTVSSTWEGHSYLNAPWRGARNGDWFYLASKGNGNIVRYNFVEDTAELLPPSFPGKSPMDIAFDRNGNAYILVRDTDKAIFKYAGADFSAAPEVFATLSDGPVAMKFDTHDNLIVTTMGCEVYCIAHDGSAKVIAGIRGAKETDDGNPGEPLTAKFGPNLWGIDIDKDGNIYIVDNGNHVIRLITPGTNGYEDAVVTTIVGTHGKSGATNGDGREALLAGPMGIAVNPAGNKIFVTESNGYRIREITVQ